MELPEEMRGASLSLYSDNKDLVGSKTDCKPDKKGKVKITIPANGGFVIGSETIINPNSNELDSKCRNGKGSQWLL